MNITPSDMNTFGGNPKPMLKIKMIIRDKVTTPIATGGAKLRKSNLNIMSNDFLTKSPTLKEQAQVHLRSKQKSTLTPDYNQTDQRKQDFMN